MSRQADPSGVLAAIYRFGPPPRVAMLAAHLAEQARNRLWQGYVADIGYSLVALIGGGRALGVPTFERVLGGGVAPDARTEREIAEEVVRAIEGNAQALPRFEDSSPKAAPAEP